jgi:quinoprotein glucose dehydrogenase
MKRLAAISLIALSGIFIASQPIDDKINYSEWNEYLGGPDRNHYSTLDQITPENVKDLQVAWTYEVGEGGQMQTNPIVVDGLLYGVTPTVQAFALDAATGKEVWKFGEPSGNWASTSRGVSYWADGLDKRILFTVGANLFALDARTGKVIESFGNKGKVDLHTGLPETAKDKFIISNTPGTVFEDIIIMPVRLSEGADAAPGDIRAFNIRTGKLVWSFHTIPYPNEFGYNTFPKDAYLNNYVGAGNNWSGMSVDRKRGVVYIPTGSAAFDFYGGNRKGQNLFSDCLLALNARTGKRIWHFQTTHHDIWDRDLPAPPNLIKVTHNGKKIDAVAQITKQGYVFLFDRDSGKPLFKIDEKRVPSSTIPEESVWATQPIPTKPLPYARQSHTLTENDISPYAENRDELIAKFKTYHKEQYAPPSKEGTVILPGYDGGGEWGGAAADPEEGILYVNSNEMAWILNLVENPKKEQLASMTAGEKVYSTTCVACHGADRKGNPKSGFPNLVDIEKRRDTDFVSNIIKNGKGMMPGNALSNEDRLALVAFLFGDEKKEVSASNTSKAPQLPYRTTGYNKFLDKDGLPAISPPWGTLNAIDLNTGEYLWKIPLGEEEKLKEKGITNTGTENYGGPIVTANGLLFIAATKDAKFRAFDKKTGKLLWQTQLPAAAFATPATYQINGKQYIVLPCGGTKLGTPKGNKYVAFALP